MDLVNIPLLKIAVAALLTMPVGFLWFSPWLFGNRWIALNNLSKDKMKPSPMPFVVALLCQVVAAFVLWLLIEMFGITDIMNAWIVAAVLWFTFHFLPSLTHHMFDQRPMGLLFINTGHDLANLLVMSLLLTLWR